MSITIESPSKKRKTEENPFEIVQKIQNELSQIANKIISQQPELQFYKSALNSIFFRIVIPKLSFPDANPLDTLENRYHYEKGNGYAIEIAFADKDRFYLSITLDGKFINKKGNFRFFSLAYEINNFIVKPVACLKALDPRSFSEELYDIKPRELNHKNILQIFHILDYNAQKFYRTNIVYAELMNEGSLEDYLKNNQISFRKTMKIARAVLDGLNFLHSKELLHRDIKPANILVHSESVEKNGTSKKKFQFKIGDLDTVISASDPRLIVSDFKGEKMSPEVIGTFGFIPLDSFGRPRCTKDDIYALGITFKNTLFKELYSKEKLTNEESTVNTLTDDMCLGSAEKRPAAKDLLEIFSSILKKQ
jgi:hypothetical protein